MSAPPELAELTRALSRALAAERVGWYVFGAQAVIAYGVPRLTGDLDVTIDLPPGRLDGLLRALDEQGFTPRTDDPSGFAERTRVLPLAYRDSGIAVDLVLAGPGLEQEFLSRARPRLLAGVEVPLISAEDLVVTKILAGRPKDLEDVRGIVAARGPDPDPDLDLDLARIRHLLGQLEQALDRRDLLPELERAVDHR